MRTRRNPTLLTTLLAALLLCSLLSAYSVQARETASTLDISFPEIATADLPKEAQKTLALIYQGGPFPYARDGITFGNREKRLPKAARGYYLEYTVKTPQEKTRGARRIICGGKAPAAPDVCYYTRDHYETFSRIRNAPVSTKDPR